MSLPIEARRADALWDFLLMPTNAGKSGNTLTGEFWGHLNGVAGTLGFPLWRRVSLMLITMLVAATGAHRTLLQRLIGGWAFALAFRREALACLDVAHSAAASLAPSRRCRVRGALIDELLLVTGPAPLLKTNLSPEPRENLHAADASPDGAGGCSASTTQDVFLLLYDLAEEKEEHVRLDGKGEEAPSNMHDGRAAAALIAMKLN